MHIDTCHFPLPHLSWSRDLLLTALFFDHNVRGDSSPELPPLTGYEPSGIADDQEDMHFTEDEQFNELEEIRVRLWYFHQSIVSSTQDSAESNATPQEADFDDEQLRALLASPLYLQERGGSAERSQVCHSERESLMSSSSRDPKPVGTGKLVAVFSSQNTGWPALLGFFVS